MAFLSHSNSTRSLILIIHSTLINCVRGTRTQPLIRVGYSVHYQVSCAISKGGFFEIAFVSTQKFYFGLSLHTLRHGSSLSLEKECDSWCMHQ